MTFPSGSPGGYQGQPQQGPNYGQPQQGPGYPPPAPRPGPSLKLSIPDILALAVGFLGLVSLFIGFAPRTTGLGFYDFPQYGWVPTVLGVAGLLAVLVVLPGNKDVKWGGLVALVNFGSVLPVLFSFWLPSLELGAGAIILMILSILQLLGAIALYLLESGLVKLPAAKPAYPAYGGYGGYAPPPQQGQPGQQAPPQQGPAGYGPPSGPQATQAFGAAQPPQQQPYGQPGQPGGTTPPASPGSGPETPPGGFGGTQSS